MSKLKDYFSAFIKIIKHLSTKWWGQLILISLPVFVIFFPFLFGIKVMATLDFTDLCYPLFTFYKNALANHSGFLINPLILNGFPSYAGTYLGFLSPLIYLTLKILPPVLAIQWLLFLYMIFGGFFVTRILKELGCSARAGLVAGYTFVLSSNYIELSIAANTLWLPLIFWLMLLIIKRNSWLLTILTSAVVGMGFLTVHSNWMVITMVGALIFALYLIIVAEHQKKRSFLLKFFILFALAFLISLIQVIPSSISVLNSVRSANSGFFTNPSSATNIYFGNLVKLFLPLTSDIPHLPWGSLITYLGTLPLVFAFYTFFISRENKKVIFWQIFSGFFILTALPSSPLLKLISQIPLIGQLRTPVRWVIPSLFSLSVLSGFGFDAWLNGTREDFKKKVYKIFKWILLLIIVLCFVLTIIYSFLSPQILNWAYRYFDTHLYAQTQQLPLEHYHQVIKTDYGGTIKQFVYNNPKLIVQILMVLLSLLVLKYFWFKDKLKKYFSPLVVTMIVLNLIVIYPFFYLDKMIPAAYLNNYMPATAKYIKQHPGKIFPFLQGQSGLEKLNLPYHPDMTNYFVFHSELLVPDINMLYNIPSIDGHESMTSERQVRLLGLLGTTRLQGTGFRCENLNDLPTLEEKIKTFHQRQNLLDLFGADYVISVYDLIEDENFTRVHVATTTAYNIPFYIYQNHDPLPFVWLADKVIFLKSSDLIEKIDVIRNPANDFHQQTFIECADCGPDLEDKKLSRQIKIIKQINTRLEIEYKSEGNNWLIINQSNMPGWEAKIDSAPTQIYYANFVHQAIFVPAGEHTIIIEYKYPLKYFWKKFLGL